MSTQAIPNDAVEVLITRLASIRAEEGEVPAAMVRLLADTAGVSVRTAYRWVAAGTRVRGQRPKQQLSPQLRDLYFELNGSVRRLVRHCQHEHIPCPPRETLRRLIAANLTAAERAYAKHGEHARRANTLYLAGPELHRNAVWQADHKQLGVLVKPPKANSKPVDPWLTTFMDYRHRVVAGVAISLQPTAAEVLTAFRAGVLKETDRVNALWGLPDEVHWDNGREYLSEAVTQAALTLGVLPRALPAYAPHLKGRIERWHRTLDEEFLATLPFFQHGPRAASGRLYGSPEAMLTYEHFCLKLLAYIEHYNFERQHSQLDGLTPAQSWAEDQAAVREAPAEKLRWMLLPSVERKIGTQGIHFRGHKYLAPELVALVSETVVVRAMPHDERSIDVYRGEEFVCTATVAEELSAEDTRRLLQHRQEQAREATRARRRASRRARVRYTAISKPADSPEQVTVFDGTQARNDDALTSDRTAAAERVARAQPSGLNQPWSPPDRDANNEEKERP